MDCRKYDVNVTVIVHHKALQELCNKDYQDYQDFGKFNSLGNTLTNSRSTMSLSSCMRFTLMKQHLDMYTYKVVTQQRRRWLVTFDIAMHNRSKDRRYLLGYLLMFQFRILSNSISMSVRWLYNSDYESVRPEIKLNLITWWICFSFKKVDRRKAIIHVCTKTPPTQGRTVHAKWTAIHIEESSTDECKYS